MAWYFLCRSSYPVILYTQLSYGCNISKQQQQKHELWKLERTNERTNQPPSKLNVTIMPTEFSEYILTESYRIHVYEAAS